MKIDKKYNNKENTTNFISYMEQNPNLLALMISMNFPELKKTYQLFSKKLIVMVQ